MRFTDWRQQDALIGIMTGLRREKFFRDSFLYSTFVIITNFTFFTALYLMSALIASRAFNAFWIFFTVILFYFILRLGQQYARGFLRAKYYVADRIASYLTGDPVAVIVVLNTLNTLNGILPTLKGAYIPSVNDRIQMLDALVRTPWPRAPYAAVSIPSISQVTIGTYLLTAPFSPNRDVSPVPESAYVPLQ